MTEPSESLRPGAFLKCGRRLVVLFLLSTSLASAYSVLTHEAVVDALWDDPIAKMLLKRFPGASPEDLKEAHAYAYGGCVIQDMGYYPFGNKQFSDLTHYVRSGDFIKALIAESQNVDEYAFALGALAHYAADINGHGLAVNVSVPILYPRLRTRFGAIVTYWDNPRSHIRTELGLDALQVAKGHYASDKYRDFIGFEVSKPLLERAVRDTYGLEMTDLFGNLDLALGTFRYATSSVIPQMTRLAWKIGSNDIVKDTPGMTKRRFLFNLSRSSYRKQWGTKYQRPGFGVEVLAFLLRLVPKIGPFSVLAFRAPTPQVDTLYMKSFNATVTQYNQMLLDESNDRLDLPNRNFDTGLPTEPGKYLGADLAYDKLLDELAGKKFTAVSADLRGNILQYYEGRQPPQVRAGGKETKAQADWQKVTGELEQLRQLQPGVVAAR